MKSIQGAKSWPLLNFEKVKSMVFLSPTIQRKSSSLKAGIKHRKLTTTKQLGDAAEDAALRYLQQQGLQLLQRNYRTPGRGGGEIDLILQESDSTVVFVEVRQRTLSRFGGALASVGMRKQQRIIFAARFFLMRLRQLPPTRFDVIAWEPEGMVWLKAAFDAES